MLDRKLTIGYSPCPNDTFIFYAFMHGKVPLDQIHFEMPQHEDVETLNAWALEGRLDITKLSFHALGHVLDKYVLLSSGAALGRGCGPLLVAKEPVNYNELQVKKIAIPGRYTTAAMLVRLFAPQCHNLVPMRFDEIMPSIASGEVDAGVIIHESRFTYQELGLLCVQDLGAWWEEVSGCPIPLGGIAAKRSLGNEVIKNVETAIRKSVLWAQNHPDQCRNYIHQHAQELDDSVIQNHIELYVNNFSVDIDTEGRDAIETLLKKGHEVGIFSRHWHSIFVP